MLLVLAIGGWTLGAVCWFAVQTIRILRFGFSLRTAQLAPAGVQCQTRELAGLIGLRNTPQVWLVGGTCSPSLWAVGCRARLLFPRDLLDRIDLDSRATLIVHELAHFQRLDHWVRLLELVVTGLFWWHPVVWLARQQIELAEEQCCDACVVEQFPARPRCYAEALLETIDFLCEQKPRLIPAASQLGDAAFIRKRLRRIMSGTVPDSMSGSTRMAVLTAAAILLPTGPALFGTAGWSLGRRQYRTLGTSSAIVSRRKRISGARLTLHPPIRRPFVIG